MYHSNLEAESDSDSYYSDSDIGPEGVNYEKFERPQDNQNFNNNQNNVPNMPFFHEIGSIPLPSFSSEPQQPKKRLRFFTPGIITNFPVSQDSSLHGAGLPVVDPTHPNYPAYWAYCERNKKINKAFFKH